MSVFKEVMAAQLDGLESALVIVKQQLEYSKREQIWAEDGSKAIGLASDMIISALESKIALCKACGE